METDTKMIMFSAILGFAALGVIYYSGPVNENTAYQITGGYIGIVISLILGVPAAIHYVKEKLRW